MASVIVEMK